MSGGRDFSILVIAYQQAQYLLNLVRNLNPEKVIETKREDIEWPVELPPQYVDIASEVFEAIKDRMIKEGFGCEIVIGKIPTAVMVRITAN